MGLTGRMGEVGVIDRALAFWGLGQVGVAIKGPTGVLYVDPYLTDSDGDGGRLERSFPPPWSPRRSPTPRWCSLPTTTWTTPTPRPCCH